MELGQAPAVGVQLVTSLKVCEHLSAVTGDMKPVGNVFGYTELATGAKCSS